MLVMVEGLELERAPVYRGHGDGVTRGLKDEQRLQDLWSDIIKVNFIV